MGDYGIYVWPAYGFVLLGMIVILVRSVLYRHKIKRHLMSYRLPEKQ